MAQLESLCLAAAQVRILCHPHDKRLHRAALRAAEYLPAVFLDIKWEQGNVVGIPSHTQIEVWYLTTDATCDCLARGYCWHIEAWHILSILSAAADHVYNDKGERVLALPFPIREDTTP
jgi:hypothetical protein